MFFIPILFQQNSKKWILNFDLDERHPQDCLQVVFPIDLFVYGSLGESQTRQEPFGEDLFYHINFALTSIFWCRPRSFGSTFMSLSEK